MQTSVADSHVLANTLISTETKENPRDAAWIKKNQKRRFPARRLCVAKKPGHSPLKWGCDDPSVYSFKPTCPLPDSDDPEQKVTVHEYYAKRYDVHLKYPKVCILLSCVDRDLRYDSLECHKMP